VIVLVPRPVSVGESLLVAYSDGGQTSRASGVAVTVSPVAIQPLPYGQYLTDGMRLLMVVSQTATEIWLEDAYTEEILELDLREFALLKLKTVEREKAAAAA
jgi:hypothetical protein